MKKIILLVGVVTFIIGCSKSSDPGVTEKIDLGYDESVTNCDLAEADYIYAVTSAGRRLSTITARLLRSVAHWVFETRMSCTA